jgi:hypothetical protein
MNPPHIGPRTGPKSGPAENIAMATPRFSGSNKSETTPPPIVRHPDPPRPVSSRKTITEEKLGARAHPIWKRTKVDVDKLRIIRRPYISLSGDKNNGPNCPFVSHTEPPTRSLLYYLHRSRINRT